MLTIYIIDFLLFSFLGWIIDSGYRSFIDRKWINAGYFRGPICPIYGFGGLTLVFIFTYFEYLNPLWVWLIAAVAMTVVEYIGGIFSEKILKIKLWDYSDAKWNIGGHIDLLHSLYWLLLVILFGSFIFPIVLLFEEFILGLIYIPEVWDIPLFLLFIVIAIAMTIRKDPSRYLDIHKKVANLSVGQYQKVFTNINKLRKSRSIFVRERLKCAIDQQLKNTGAYLKKIKK